MIKSLMSLVSFLYKQPSQVISLPLRTAQACHRVTPFYSPKYPQVLFRAARLHLDHGFNAQEALQYGLLELDFPKDQLCKFTSKHEMVTIQQSLNPAVWRSLTENKSIFYTYCKALGLPVPKLYAIFFNNGTAGYATDGLFLRVREEWEHFIDVTLPSKFVIKPANGAYGADVMVFERTQNGKFLNTASGEAYKAKDLYNVMLSYSHINTFVIQERLMNHPDLINLSDSEYLQTLRIWTFVDRDGQCHILHAFLKPIVGDNITDNLDHGKTGNLAAQVSLGSGTLKPAAKMVPDSSGLQTVFSHPETGIVFEGFQVPLWNETCVLVKEAQLKFMPLRIIGWDVALTPNGPFIVEGNWNADPPSFHRNMDFILNALREDPSVLHKNPS